MAVKMTVFAIGLVIGGLLPTVIVGTVFSQADVSKELVGALLSLLGLIIVILIHR